MRNAVESATLRAPDASRADLSGCADDEDANADVAVLLWPDKGASNLLDEASSMTDLVVSATLD